MKSAFDRPLKPGALLALVLLALAAPRCASDANPVLPSTGNPPHSGLVGGGGLDSGAADLMSTSDLRDVAPDLTTSDVAQSTSCNLLDLKDCSNKGFKDDGCYPVLGASVCLPAGQLFTLTTCTPDQSVASSVSNTQRCAPGLVCISSTQLGYVCVPLCAVGGTTDPELACVGGTCVSLQNLTSSGAGYCNALI